MLCGVALVLPADECCLILAIVGWALKRTLLHPCRHRRQQHQTASSPTRWKRTADRSPVGLPHRRRQTSLGLLLRYIDCRCLMQLNLELNVLLPWHRRCRCRNGRSLPQSPDRARKTPPSTLCRGLLSGTPRRMAAERSESFLENVLKFSFFR